MTGMNPRVPKLAEKLLSLFLPFKDKESLLATYEYIFFEQLDKHGYLIAFVWYWSHVLRTIPRYISNTIYWGVVMFKSYLLIAFRNIQKYKLYSAINIVSFSLGLAISIILAFYVIDDLTFDTFDENSDDIYRVLTIDGSGGDDARTYSITAGPLLPAMHREIPEVIGATRLFTNGNIPVKAGEDEITGPDDPDALNIQSLLADSTFFSVFDFEILAGDSLKALKEPGGVLLTAKYAALLFGKENPIGKKITTPVLENAHVSAIIEEPPVNSHIEFGIIIPLRVETNEFWFNRWENILLSGYVRLNKNADVQNVEEKIISLYREHTTTDIFTPKLQRFKDVHLGSADFLYDFMNRKKNDINIVYAVGIIGFMILSIAVINFVNLTSARASKRAREIGIRKVIGSNKSRLLFQFLGESVMLTVFTMVIAVLAVEFALPYLSGVLGKDLEINSLGSPLVLLAFALFALFAGILAGLYPALIMSSYKPTTVLKGSFSTSAAGVFVRRFLVVFQFTLTMTILTGIFIIYNQIEFLKNTDVGYNREQVVVISERNQRNNNVYMNLLSTNTNVISIGRTALTPDRLITRVEVIPEGYSEEESFMFQQFSIDGGFLSTLNIELIEGRGFSQEYPGDTLNSIIVNEAALRTAGWTSGVGKIIRQEGEGDTFVGRRIVGVVKDFHYQSVRNVVEPMMMVYREYPRNLLIRLAGGNIETTINSLREAYAQAYPNAQFDYRFLDEIFNAQFENDELFANYITLLSALAIFISCIGLFGLVSYSIEQRYKEIAVRKILGSGERKIIQLLSGDSIKWILIAIPIAWVLSYYASGIWLEGFVFRLPFTVTPYIISAVLTLAIAFLTTLGQSVRASRMQPVDNLRNE